VAVFCDAILKIKSTLDFEVSARGWCYVLEEHGLRKNGFDSAEKLINNCRKNGKLPLDICGDDDSTSAENLEDIDEESPEEFAAARIAYISRAHHNYDPISFWENQEYYVEMPVEKIDLKSLFSPVCAEFYVPIYNMKGWSDINQRAKMMLRFRDWEARGKKCVLLPCTDLDPGGLNIANFLHSNLEDLAEAVGWHPDNLIIDRFGLNADFVKKQKLTWIENLHTAKGEYPLDDLRHSDHSKSYVQSYLREFGARKVEANALVVRPKAGRALCRRAILKYIDLDAAEEYQRRLEDMRGEVRIILTRIMGGQS
jgi:hypothetical protein